MGGTPYFLIVCSWYPPSLRYDAYLKAAQQFTWSQGAIFEINSAASEIDRILTDCITSVSLHAAYGELS